MEDDRSSQIKLLNVAKTYEHARITEMGTGSHTQRRNARGQGLNSETRDGERVENVDQLLYCFGM